MERGESQTGNLGVKNGPILFLLALAVGCGAPDRGRADADALTQADAANRSAMVGDVAYEVYVDLTESDGYTGRVNIAFKAVSATRPLTLDFGGGTVDELNINGQRIDADYNGAFIALPAGAIVDGRNEVRIAYRRPYSTDGSGVYRFVDPEDDRPYVYTYLWPYYANRLFPAFDQPDLKATYKLTVRAPRDWTVVSAARETSVEADGGSAVWTFPPTERFSTYIFSLHAGPYTVWEDRAGDVPIRLFARQSLAPHVPVEEWLDVTRRGLTFYGDYFGIPYPFHKYDQLIVPDSTIGAMENVAAVTFAESFVQRGPSTRFQREDRANVILHEMAHMWFGNLVTKEWWNGLWLNESFATYMASLAVAEATDFKGAWHTFFLMDKQSA
jgi:aminopeptidase N